MRILIVTVLCFGSIDSAHASPPNVVVIFCDDLGYGDLGCYGHPSIRTPHLDRMAAEGMKFTNFYVAESVCTPSRAALLTGRLPIRSGMCAESPRVLYPDSTGGLPAHEITIAKALKTQNYATACIGKWHLGHRPEFLPTKHGFDSYFGIPYSNDMDRREELGAKGRDAIYDPKTEYWNVPLLRNETEIERPTNQHAITKRYTQEAISFIQANAQKPFFLYLAHTMPHVPLFASDTFAGKSPRGRYGDTVEELDWSVGELLRTLREQKLDSNTLVLFTSDNGPWLMLRDHSGSAGLLRDGKNSTWEGGMRVPGIAWWPGTVPAGVTTDQLACTLDLLPTIVKLAGAELPTDRTLDGFDLTPLLKHQHQSPRQTMFYYRSTKLYAVRHGPWKAHFVTRSGLGPNDTATHNPPLLYHLAHDPSEQFNIAEKHPEVLNEIVKIVATHQAELTPGQPQFGIRTSMQK